MQGLESVKDQFLVIKNKIDTLVRQGVSLKRERFGAALLGNPGTGKFPESSEGRTDIFQGKLQLLAYTPSFWYKSELSPEITSLRVLVLRLLTTGSQPAKHISIKFSSKAVVYSSSTRPIN
jgi:hypothetical protein